MIKWITVYVFCHLTTHLFIALQGLTIVDVYSEWSGPCSAMTNFLKKIKLEVNDDLLSYAMAKSDTIPQLEIFRGQCKPIWLFMASGTSSWEKPLFNLAVQCNSFNLHSLIWSHICRHRNIYFAGESVAVLHGANAPLLQKMIEREIQLERQVLRGEIPRETITFEEALPTDC